MAGHDADWNAIADNGDAINIGTGFTTRSTFADCADLPSALFLKKANDNCLACSSGSPSKLRYAAS
jgi:hypothetical protein